MRVEGGDVVEEVLLQRKRVSEGQLGGERKEGGREAYGGGGVVGTLGHYCMLEAVLAASVGSRVAIADGGPGPVYSGAAAGEEEVVLLSVGDKRELRSAGCRREGDSMGMARVAKESSVVKGGSERSARVSESSDTSSKTHVGFVILSRRSSSADESSRGALQEIRPSSALLRADEPNAETHLDGDDNGRVGRISKDVTSDAILFPAKRVGL